MQPGVLADYKVAAVLVLTVSFLLNVYSTERNSKSINNSTEKKAFIRWTSADNIK